MSDTLVSEPSRRQRNRSDASRRFSSVDPTPVWWAPGRLRDTAAAFLPNGAPLRDGCRFRADSKTLAGRTRADFDANGALRRAPRQRPDHTGAQDIQELAERHPELLVAQWISALDRPA